MFWTSLSKIKEETKPRLLEKLQLPPIRMLMKSLNYTFSKYCCGNDPLISLKKH